MADEETVRPVKRFITTHNSEGKAVFSSAIPEQAAFQVLPDGAGFFLGYATSTFPVELSSDTDIQNYSSYLSNLPGITIPGGTVMRVVNMLPGATSPMHRTVSLDYGVVIEGEVELVLDSGETRRMGPGDMAVQRGTNHAWRNMSETKWARMLYVLQEARPIVVEGRELEEDYGGIPGVRPSKGH
jgi:quercetin dioxygenase-like cupin family protein